MNNGKSPLLVMIFVGVIFCVIAIVIPLANVQSFMENIKMEIQNKEGHYELCGTKVFVYQGGGDCTYDIDPVTGMVSRIVRGAKSVDMEPLNLTKEELFKGLEEKGFTLYKDSEDKGTE